MITNLTRDLNNLTQTPLLKPDQKLKIVNEYIWPGLIYPLQCAPLDQLPDSFLKDLDKVIRSAVKEMTSLPEDTPNDMLYSSKKVRGLGLIKAEWEANIQHFNICKRLSQVSDDHLLLVRNLEEEKKTALKRLKIPEANITPRTTGIHLRDELRKRSFDSWCQLPHKGKGVVIYEEYPRANSWVSTKRNLSSSEYINAIKMSCNLTAVRSVPGRAFSTTRCRQPGCNETETLGHVLGFGRKGELLRNNRHHRVRGAIACLLRNKGWEVHEEVHCISEDDSHRRADIIAINRQQQKAIIIDPTIRMERDLNQAHQASASDCDVNDWRRPSSMRSVCRSSAGREGPPIPPPAPQVGRTLPATGPVKGLDRPAGCWPHAHMTKQRWTIIQPELRYRVVSTMIPPAVIAGIRNRIRYLS
ncbi:hypothetical protein ANN_00755 [Periplaneta americana]|uniref:Uncharacterized protein n=1 Tax=Periplaneta americana TaxID=6978 RepID=A0ABQ8TUJ1_PERAM|nr:hypothetical protein ANN_00755 [Periplaneta americana]